MDDSCNDLAKCGLQTSRAKELVREVIEYKNSKTIELTEPFNTYRVFLGISDYPDGSNITSIAGYYRYLNEVAFFSKKSKPDLFFVLAILLGGNEAAYDLIDCVNSKKQIAPVSWNDIVEYLAMVKGIYFINYNDNCFAAFRNALPSTAIVKYLVFSSSVIIRNLFNGNGFLKSNNSAAFIIHPSARNLNEHPSFWFRQYVLNQFNGPINSSNKGGLTYNDFQI